MTGEKMKRLLSVLLALTLLAALCACGETSAPAADAVPDASVTDAVISEEAAEETVTINVVTPYGGSDDSRRDYENAVAGYEAATGNVVNDASAAPNEAWKAKILADFQADAEPDVLCFYTDAAAEPFISAGKVVSIDAIRAEYPDYAANMNDGMLPLAADGQRYAVPTYGSWVNMFVNRSVLDACGVAVPGPDYTWEQFIADCRIIRDNGYTPIACSLSEMPDYWFEFAVMNNGTAGNRLELPTLDENGRLAEDEISDKWIAALDDIKTLYESGFFPVNTLTADDAVTVDMFAQGAAAFLIDSSEKIDFFTENHGDEVQNYAVAYVPAKGGRRATEVIGSIPMGYFITEKAWNDPAKRDAAVGFVSYLTSDEVLGAFVTSRITALANGADHPGLNELQRSAAAVNAEITALTGSVCDTFTDDAISELFGNVPDVVTGQMSARAAVESAVRLNEGK